MVKATTKNVKMAKYESKSPWLEYSHRELVHLNTITEGILDLLVEDGILVSYTRVPSDIESGTDTQWRMLYFKSDDKRMEYVSYYFKIRPAIRMYKKTKGEL